jgi:small-conductance mechanosensitive channel
MDMHWIQTNLWDPLKPFWDQLAIYFPRVIVALIVLLVGWFIALLLSRVVVKFFKLIRLDYWADKLHVDSFLREGGLKMTAMQLVEKTIYWILMFCVILLALNALELRGANEMFQRVTAYIPNVIFAIVVLVVGAFIARIAQGALQVYLTNVGVTSASAVARIAQYAIVVVTILIALEQLKIAQIVIQMVSYAFAAICFAFGLAFGLGGKEWASGVISRWSQKR